MVNLNPEVIKAGYSQEGLKSLVFALNSLVEAKLFDLVVAENNRLLVESFGDESEEELAKKILDNRQTNRILLSIPTLIPIIQGVIDDA